MTVFSANNPCRFVFDNRWNLAEFGCGLLAGIGLVGLTLKTVDWMVDCVSQQHNLLVVSACPIASVAGTSPSSHPLLLSSAISRLTGTSSAASRLSAVRFHDA